MSYLDENWKDMLEKKFPGKNGDEIWKKIRKEILKKFPKTQYQPEEEEDIFNVFEMPISKIKVVILGQDPYHTKGKATGYAFAVPPDTDYKLKGRESLIVIKEEIEKEKELGLATSSVKNWQTLKHWRDSGVFLLNTALTVEIGKKRSHLGEWENFTKKVIEYISENHPCIWMLWGGDAKKFKKYICKPKEVSSEKDIEGISAEDKKNYILEAYHPTAYGNKFCNRDHNNFLYANKILGKEKIEW